MNKKTLQNALLYAYKAAIYYDIQDDNRYKIWYAILSNQKFIEVIEQYSNFIHKNKQSITEDKLRETLIKACGEENVNLKCGVMHDSPIKASTQTCRQDYLSYTSPKKNDETSERSIQKLMDLYIEITTPSYITDDNREPPANCQKLFNEIDKRFKQEKIRVSPLKNQRDLKSKQIKELVDDGDLDHIISEPTCKDFFYKIINNLKHCCYGTDNESQITKKLEWQEFITQLPTYKIIQKS